MRLRPSCGVHVPKTRTRNDSIYLPYGFVRTVTTFGIRRSNERGRGCKKGWSSDLGSDRVDGLYRPAPQLHRIVPYAAHDPQPIRTRAPRVRGAYTVAGRDHYGRPVCTAGYVPETMAAVKRGRARSGQAAAFVEICVLTRHTRLMAEEPCGRRDKKPPVRRDRPQQRLPVVCDKPS